MKLTTTMSCGHEDVIEVFGTAKEREKQIWKAQNFRLCSECYRKKIQEDGLLFRTVACDKVDPDTGDYMVLAWFDGDSYPYKEKIKSLGGYHFGTLPEPDGTTDLPVSPRWYKFIKLQDLDKAVLSAKEIGAACNVPEAGDFHKADKDRKEWEQKQAMSEKQRSIPKPDKPEILGNAHWNGKFYRAGGDPCIYLNNERVILSSDEKQELEEYLEEREKYRKIIKELG